MIDYNGNNQGYTFVSYGSDDGSSGETCSVKTNSWRKSTCCQSYKFGQRCSDCPNN